MRVYHNGKARGTTITDLIPAFWRIVLGVNLLYELALVFLLFQDLDSARAMMKYLDPGLGVALPEKSYAENCEFTPQNIWVMSLIVPCSTLLTDFPECNRHLLSRPCIGLVWEGADTSRLLVLLGKLLA